MKNMETQFTAAHKRSSARKESRGNHRARKMCREEYAAFDYIICMERYNIQNIMRIIGNDPEHKVQRLLDYTNRPRDIADPWYTGNFDETFDDVMEGCQAFLSYLMEHLQ